MRYLGNRYQSGVDRVETFMSKHQRYQLLAGLDDGLPDILAHIQENDVKSCFECIVFSVAVFSGEAHAGV